MNYYLKSQKDRNMNSCYGALKTYFGNSLWANIFSKIGSHRITVTNFPKQFCFYSGIKKRNQRVKSFSIVLKFSLQPVFNKKNNNILKFK